MKKDKKQDAVKPANRTMGIPRLLTLKEAVAAFGTSGVTTKVLRGEVNAGRLKACRPRPGSTAKILITEEELLRWLDEVAGARQYVMKPGRGKEVTRG